VRYSAVKGDTVIYSNTVIYPQVSPLCPTQCLQQLTTEVDDGFFTAQLLSTDSHVHQAISNAWHTLLPELLSLCLPQEWRPLRPTQWCMLTMKIHLQIQRGPVRENFLIPHIKCCALWFRAIWSSKLLY